MMKAGDNGTCELPQEAIKSRHWGECDFFSRCNVKVFSSNGCRKESEMLDIFEFDPIGGEWGLLLREQETSRYGRKKMMILLCPC